MAYFIVCALSLFLYLVIKTYEDKKWWNDYSKSPYNFRFKHKGKTMWYSRSCAVACFVFCKNRLGQWHVLANQRGFGCPNYQFYWNCCCGFLDMNETIEQACIRECQEETGIKLKLSDLNFYGINSTPKGNQNITIRYYAELDGCTIEQLPPMITNQGEKDEVNAVAWIPIKDVNNEKYLWAFGHKNIIREIYNNIIAKAT